MQVSITPTRVALHGKTVAQLMVIATVVQTAMPSTTVVKMLTAIHVIIASYTFNDQKGSEPPAES